MLGVVIVVKVGEENVWFGEEDGVCDFVVSCDRFGDFSDERIDG